MKTTQRTDAQKKKIVKELLSTSGTEARKAVAKKHKIGLDCIYRWKRLLMPNKTTKKPTRKATRKAAKKATKKTAAASSSIDLVGHARQMYTSQETVIEGLIERIDHLEGQLRDLRNGFAHLAELDEN